MSSALVLHVFRYTHIRILRVLLTLLQLILGPSILFSPPYRKVEGVAAKLRAT
jgi:hypothetical protein